MPFDASTYRSTPAPFDEERAFSRVPAVRGPVRQHVLRLPLTPDQEARAAFYRQTGKTPEEEDRASSRMTGFALIGLALGWVLIAWLAFTIGSDALHLILGAMDRGAAEAAERSAY